MTEIQKYTKITLLVYALGGFVFAFLYLVIPDIYIYGLSQWPFNDPVYFRFFGGTLLVLGLFALLAYFKKEWEEVQMIFQLSLTWLLMVLVINILELVFLTLPDMAFTNTIVNTMIVILFIVLGIYCCMKQKV